MSGKMAAYDICYTELLLSPPVQENVTWYVYMTSTQRSSLIRVDFLFVSAVATHQRLGYRVPTCVHFFRDFIVMPNLCLL